jgi:hypothetical protein
VCKYWAAGTERAHEREQAMLECDVPNNGTRRRSSGGELLREMQKRGSRIEDAAKVFDEMLTAGEVMPTALMCNALIKGHRGKGKGNGRHGPNASRPRSSRMQKWKCSMVSRKEKRRNEGGGYSAAVLKGATVRVCRPCLSGTRAWTVKA